MTDYSLIPPHPTAEFWLLAILAIIAEIRPFVTTGAMRRITAIHLSTCFTFAIMLLWGPGPAIVVQSLAIITAQIRRPQGLGPTLTAIGRMAAAFAVAEIVFQKIGPPALDVGGGLSQDDVVSVIAAAVTWFVVNYALVVVEVRLRQHAPWKHLFTRTLAHEFLSVGALLLLAPLLISAPTGWVLVLALVPIVAVSQMARLSEEQESLLRIDPLTGLLSRRAISAEVSDLTESLARRRNAASNPQFALLLIDLDRFKNVNDALGHTVGDELLARVADRLAASVRPRDLVARLGGDEFAIVARAVPDEDHAMALAARISGQLQEPIYLDGLPLDVSASIGVAMYPRDGEDFTTLMRHADVAMYSAKRRGADASLYSPATDTNSADRLALLADLRLALEPEHAHELSLVYQPQVDIRTGTVVGLEALLRWQHPLRGSVSPTEIVRTAENSAVMLQLTFRIVDHTIAQLASWHAAGYPVRVSINVSVRDLHTGDIVDHVAQTLQRNGVNPSSVEIEITETALMADPEPVMTTVARLAKLGVGLSLDDFGTGYSSLLHLRQLPLSEVKIDQSFVRSMATNPSDASIVVSIIGLAHGLGLRVVAEGVENGNVAELLAGAGCDLAQGWYYGHPMPASAVIDWLAVHQRDIDHHRTDSTTS